MRDSNLDPTLPARESAFLIIDVQRGLFCADPPPWAADGIIERINACSAAFRKAGAPVFVIQHDGTDEEELSPGSSGWELMAELEISREDIRLRKTTCDAFYGTALHEELRQRGIKHLVISGYATEYCIESTVRAGVSRDYQVWVVSDAHTTNDTPVLSARKVIEHHNHTWPNCTAKDPVRLIKTEDLTRAVETSAAYSETARNTSL